MLKLKTPVKLNQNITSPTIPCVIFWNYHKNAVRIKKVEQRKRRKQYYYYDMHESYWPLYLKMHRNHVFAKPRTFPFLLHI